VTDAAKLAESLRATRAAGTRIALCHGVFDLLHPGHLRHLARARELADLLIVSITADAFVTKGPGRPAFAEDLRAESLAALRVVDHVVITRDATALPTIDALAPDLYVKGSDYLDPQSDPTGNIARERALVERHGGKVVFTDERVFSSSTLINQFLPTLPPHAREYIASLKHRFSADEVTSWLDRLAKVEVTVVGESIIDAYTDCEVLGKASKDPVLCLRRGQVTSHAGGALAIAAHCRGLGAVTHLVTAFNARDARSHPIAQLASLGVELHWCDTDPRPTIRKERLVDERTQARVMELYEMDDSPLPPAVADAFTALLGHTARDGRHADARQVTIVADYGHGLLDDAAIERLSSTSTFLAVNTQANAGNRGLNSLSKYPRADYVTLNGAEARIELRRRHVELVDAVPEILTRLGASRALVTVGAAGLDLYTRAAAAGSIVSHAPALTPHVKDRVGAGDAVLAVTAMLAALDAPPEIIAFYGAVVGAWAVGFTGNEQTLTHGMLSRHVASLLK